MSDSNYPSSSEDETSLNRAKAEETLLAILQTNPRLAERARDLDDVFEIKSLISTARLDDTESRGPPPYGQPTSEFDQLPQYSPPAVTGTCKDGSISIGFAQHTVFSGLTLADISIFSLVALPIVCDELRYGNEFYTAEYCSRVHHQLTDLVEKRSRKKSYWLAVILGVEYTG